MVCQAHPEVLKRLGTLVFGQASGLANDLELAKFSGLPGNLALLTHGELSRLALGIAVLPEALYHNTHLSGALRRLVAEHFDPPTMGRLAALCEDAPCYWKTPIPWDRYQTVLAAGCAALIEAAALPEQLEALLPIKPDREYLLLGTSLPLVENLCDILLPDCPWLSSQ